MLESGWPHCSQSSLSLAHPMELLISTTLLSNSTQWYVWQWLIQSFMIYFIFKVRLLVYGVLIHCLIKINVEIIIVSSPHSHCHPQGFGMADTDNCACPPCCYNVSMAMNGNRLTNLAQLQVSNNFMFSFAKLIVISQPQRRCTDSVSMIPELLKLGSCFTLHRLVPCT